MPSIFYLKCICLSIIASWSRLTIIVLYSYCILSLYSFGGLYCGFLNIPFKMSKEKLLEILKVVDMVKKLFH